MKIKASNISYERTNSFSNLVIDYVHENEKLKSLIHAFPSPESINDQIKRKEKQVIDRELLQHILTKQYGAEVIHEHVKRNIQLLRSESTFTICTAHQPSVFTGQLYFIYKIIHAIKLATACKELFPDYNFVPIYYMGSEDNDIAEVGTFHYQQKTYSWHSPASGACGRMSTASLKEIWQEIKQTLNIANEDEAFLINLFERAYHEHHTLSQATRIIVNALFGKYGLVVIDGDERELKRKFIPIIQEELLTGDTKQSIEKTLSLLSTNYKIQAQPRSINLFYLLDHLRERMEKVNDRWVVLNTEISFSESELLKEIDEFPERFSPNVILRPLYQESILPNVAFIGGGGELAYWLELKALFEKHQIVYPIIFLRNSVVWLSEKTISHIAKLSINQHDIFLSKDDIFNKIIQGNEIFQQLNKIIAKLESDYQSIITLSANISASLEKSMQAHQAKAQRIERRILQKFKAALKQKEESSMIQIEKIKDQIAPNGTLQERYENFLTIYKIFGLEMFDLLYKHQEAFGKDFLILSNDRD